MSAGVIVDEIDEALSWRDRARVEPESALSRAELWLSTHASDTELRVLARHVACVASVERGQLGDARHHARLGLATAGRAGLRHREAQLRLTMAWIELDGGAIDACREHLAAAEPHLRGADLCKIACLRGLLHCQSDRYRAAVEELTDALQSLQGEEHRHWAANALVGRGLAYLYLNELDGAEADLAAAERRFAIEGRVERAAVCTHNRGCVAFRGGDLPRALRLFNEALAHGLDTEAHPETRVDRAEALAAAGMNSEARQEMHCAADRLSALGRSVRLAETRLALAGCALRDGEARIAIEAAREARRLFRDQDRPGWCALAAATLWQAKLLAGTRSWYAFVAARRVASSCAGYGWTAAAAELWLAAGRAAHECGMQLTARKLWKLAATCRQDVTATAPQRALGWIAEALLAEQVGDREQVFHACRSGLRVVEGYAAAIVAFELRVQAFGLASELSDIAVGVALRTGDPSLVLRWTECHRASALNRRVFRPPADRELRAALLELRLAVAQLRESRSGRPREAMARIADLEERVRHRAMLVSGTTGGPLASFDLDEVCRQLGEAVLVSLFVHDGQLFGLSIVDGSVRLHSLGREADVGPEVDRLRYLLTRQAEGASAKVRDAFADEVRRCSSAIEARLLGPVLAELGPGRPLVVVPTGRLHAVAWAQLPSCHGRSVTVVPSLRCWLRAAADAHDGEHRQGHVWVSGPGLEHAEREVRALHDQSGGRLLIDDAATAERVLATVDGCRTVHIAAHGWFRDDQPLLSCLDLADGPLYGYDFDRLHHAPTTVVLSACEAGRCVVSRGDELSGLAAALLGRGTATLIASVVPVPDERTAELMVSLHSALRSGAAPAAALAEAQAEHGESGFLCIGYGGR